MKAKGKSGTVSKMLLCVAMALSLIVSGPEWLDIGFMAAKAANTYEISTYAELKEFANRVNNGQRDINGVLVADIICKNNPEDENYATDWIPIGHNNGVISANGGFVGEFNGQNHTITGLCNTSDVGTYDRGLFGVVGPTGYVHDINLEDVHMVGNDVEYSSGGVAGTCKGTISGCTVSGIVYSESSGTGLNTGTPHVGGIVGYAGGTSNITDCSNSATVTGSGDVGGIAGIMNTGAQISGCTNTGDITGSYKCIGGIAGTASKSATISECTNEGNIKYDSTLGYTGGQNGQIGTSVGGIAGWTSADIIDSENSGTISGGTSNMGGIAGTGTSSGHASGHPVRIIRCSNSGTVGAENTGTSIGGIVGSHDGIVQGCENTGAVYGQYFTGGVIGYGGLLLQIIRCENEGSITGYSKTGGIAGIMSGGTIEGCTNAGSIAGTISSADPTTGTGGIVGYAMPSNNTLITDCTNTGSVTAKRNTGGIAGSSWADITDCTNTGAITSTVMDAGGIVGNNSDNDRGDRGPSIISGCSNEGEIISSINSAGGIAGCSSGIVEDCINTGAITASQNGGGIIGYSRADVSNCTNTGVITVSNTDVGGIVGNSNNTNRGNRGPCIISECSNEGNVISNIYTAGGIVGRSDGIVEDCTNAGAITAYRNGGGIVGYSWADVSNCTNTGSVSVGLTDAGGIVGVGDNTGRGDRGPCTIINCTNEGNISSNATTAGGMGGNFCGTVENCTNSGTITAASYMGGIVGYNSDVTLTITGCTNSGEIINKDINTGEYTGGIIGRLSGSVSNCVNEGNVTGYVRVAGIAGVASVTSKTITNCTNTGDITGSAWVAGIVGGEQGHPKSIISCTNEGDITFSYNTAGGIAGYYAGSADTVIEGCTNSGAIIYTGPVSSGGDLVGGIAGYTQIPVRDCSNSGAVTGNENVGGITGATDAGITGCTNTGDISGLNKVGGIAGLTSIAITLCNNTGSVTGSIYIGGITGVTGNGILRCYNAGSITATANLSTIEEYNGTCAGGIAGYSTGGNYERRILSCYNIGNISAVNIVGGITGLSQGSISDCYNIGDITTTADAEYEYPIRKGGIAGQFGDSSYSPSCDKSYYINKDTDLPAYMQYRANGNEVEYDRVTTGRTEEQKITGPNAISETGMDFTDATVWFIKDDVYNASETIATMYYPHLKGFNLDNEGAQMEAADIADADWPAKTTAGFKWISDVTSEVYDGTDKASGTARVRIAIPGWPEFPSSSDVTYYKRTGAEWTALSSAPTEAGNYKAVSMTWYTDRMVLQYIQYRIIGDGYTVSYSKLNTDTWEAADAVINKGTYKASVLLTGRTTPTFNKQYIVTARAATVIAENKEKTYGSEDPEFTATFGNMISGDSLEYLISRASGETVGEYTITPTGNAIQGNYNVTFAPGTLAIGPKTPAITISIPDTVITYDGTAHTPAVTIYDTETGDEIPNSEYNVAYSNNVNAGTATITITDVTDGNYTVSGSRTFTIQKASATVTALSASKEYGAADPALTASVSGLIGADALVYTVSRAAGENVGVYAITPTGETIQGNYTVTYVGDSFTITKKLTGMTQVPAIAENLTYNGSEQALITAGVAGEGCTIRYIIGSTVDNPPADDAEGTAEADRLWKTGAPTATNAGTYIIWYTCEPDGSHTVNTEKACLTVTIGKAAVTVSANNINATYGGAIPDLAATVTGLKGNDPASLISYSLSRDPGVTAGAYTITATGDTVQGNYTVTYVSGTLTIGPKVPTITITIPDIAITYNGTAQAPAVTVYDQTTGIEISNAEYNVRYSDNVNAGTATIAITDVAGGNYTVSGSRTFTIQKAAAVVTATNLSKEYGASDPVLTATVTGLVGTDTLTYSISRGAGENAGTYGITPSGAAEQGNYTVTYVGGTFTITKKLAGIAQVPAAIENLIYNGGDQALVSVGTAEDGCTIRYAIGETSTTPPADDAEGTLEADRVWKTGVPAAKNTGSYNVWYTCEPDGNHTVSSEKICLSSAISRAPVTVAAVSYSIEYGDSEPELGVNISGLKGEDSITSIAYTISRASGNTVGTYTITPSGSAEQGNYTVSYAPGVLTITPKVTTAVIVIPNGAITYNGTAQEPAVTVYDPITGAEISESEYNVTYADNVDAGTATITVTDRSGGEYTVNGSATFTIQQATATVTAQSVSKAYGNNDPELTAIITGLIGNETIVYEISREPGEDVGIYEIIPTGSYSQGNYAVTYNSGYLTITRLLSRMTTGPSVIEGLEYNGNRQTLITAGTAENGCTIRYAIGGTSTTPPAEDPEGTPETNRIWKTELPAATNAGTYIIWYMCEPDGNHMANAEKACMTVTINRAVATIKAANAVITYGETEPELTANVTGLKGSDAPSVISYVLSREQGISAGAYTITATGQASQGNYDVTYVPGTLTINKATVTAIAPTGNTGMMADGNIKDLVASGAAITFSSSATTGGAIKYAVTTLSGQQPDAGAYSEDIPKADKAGTYYVWWMFDGGRNYYNIEPTCITVIIGNAENNNPANGEGAQVDNPPGNPDHQNDNTSGNIKDKNAPQDTEQDQADPKGSNEKQEKPGEKTGSQSDTSPINNKAEQVEDEPWYGTVVITYTTKVKTEVTETYTKLRNGYEMKKTEAVTVKGKKTTDIWRKSKTGKETTIHVEEKPNGSTSREEVVKAADGSTISSLKEKTCISISGTKTETKNKQQSNGYSLVSREVTYTSGKRVYESWITEPSGTAYHAVTKQKADGSSRTTQLYEPATGLPELTLSAKPVSGGRLSKVYTIKKDGTLRLDKVITDMSVLTIPATETFNGKTYKVTSVTAWAVSGITSITKLKIKAENLRIGTGAFSGNENLETVIMYTASVRKIKKKAFDGMDADAVIYVKGEDKSFAKAERKIEKSESEDENITVKQIKEH